MKIFWEILWTRFSLVTSLTERIGDEAIFHRIDNSRILRLWPTYFFAIQFPKQDFYHFLLVVFLKILWGVPDMGKNPTFSSFFWGAGVPYIKPHIYVSQGFNLFICFTPFPNKWEPTSPFSPQTSISPHNLVNLPFCPKSFLNFPNQMKNLPFFRN